jgi:OOP family OmpA-OmpF porin
VKAYLADKFQVDPSRLETKGFGESKPIDSNTTPEGKANNRRVELVKLS